MVANCISHSHLWMSFVVSSLLSLQFSTFAILRSRMSDATCTPCVLLWSEVIKAGISAIAAGEQVKHLFQNPGAILAPATCFAIMNVISFWCIAHVSASLYIMMMQLKLPWTLFTSWMVLGRRFTAPQIIAVFLITITCVNIMNAKKMARATMDDYRPIIGMVVETLLSSLCSVYMQKVFGSSFDAMWVRTLELALLSMPVYVILILYQECAWFPSPMGVIFSCFASAGGILVALSLVYCGAMAKTIVTSSSIVTVTITEHILQQSVPNLSHTSFYVICVLSVVLYSTGIEIKDVANMESEKLLAHS